MIGTEKITERVVIKVPKGIINRIHSNGEISDRLSKQVSDSYVQYEE